MNRIQLSANFYLDEFLRSQAAARHGIDMRVEPEGAVANELRRLCEMILQPLRDALGPVHITSGYRPPELNQLIGGSATSLHPAGLAADFVVPGHTPLEVAQWLAGHTGPSSYDQLIHEFGEWVHVSVPYTYQRPRRELLTTFKVPSLQSTCYVSGLYSIDKARVIAGYRESE